MAAFKAKYSQKDQKVVSKVAMMEIYLDEYDTRELCRFIFKFHMLSITYEFVC